MGNKKKTVKGVESKSNDTPTTAKRQVSSFILDLLSNFLLKIQKYTKGIELVIRISVLCLVYVLAFLTRLGDVLRYNSTIQVFDPYFNYQTMLFLKKMGIYEFCKCFDSDNWYPLGRIIGGTLLYWVLQYFRLAGHIRDVCVLTSPFFASNTTLVAYFFGKEIWDSGAGLFAAAFIAICPGYISRWVLGSYDNDGVAMFALLLTFYLFVKAVNTGSLNLSLASAFGYCYMVSAWGGYVFIISLISLYVLVLLVTGRYSMRLYVAYTCMYVLGMLLALQIQYFGFQHVQLEEHMMGLGVFILLQVFCFIDSDCINAFLKKKKEEKLQTTETPRAGWPVIIALVVGIAAMYTSPWTGRFYSLLDPTYAKNQIPVIASVLEHQPTTWSSFMFNFHILLFPFVAGLYVCFKWRSDATIFIVMYGLTSMYFAGVMVHLILVAAPAMCLISAIAVSATVKHLILFVRAKGKVGHSGSSKGKTKAKASSKVLLRIGAIILLLGAFFFLCIYLNHCIWATSKAYSSPSLVLAPRGVHENRVIGDDYREAYSWLRQNTPPDAKVMSLWDYRYQITASENRTEIVDNNIWNVIDIATVGRAMSSYEDEAYEIMQSLGVDYVLVVFGGLAGYSSDDINKFLLMVRISSGVFPVIKESDYLVNGKYRIDKGAAPKMLNCLLYKLSYYRFGQLPIKYGKHILFGFDVARWVEIGNQTVKLEYFEEAFTTSQWIVRIYRVRPPKA